MRIVLTWHFFGGLLLRDRYPHPFRGREAKTQRKGEGERGSYTPKVEKTSENVDKSVYETSKSLRRKRLSRVEKSSFRLLWGRAEAEHLRRPFF